MLIFNRLKADHDFKQPIILTVGNFDGLHMGHRALFTHIKQRALQENAHTGAITFSNHPYTVLRQTELSERLCTTKHKIQLFKNQKLDFLFLLPFTQEFAQQSAEQFLLSLKEALPVKTLILGTDAHIGKNREENKEFIPAIAKNLGLTVEYFSDYIQNGICITSRYIRQLIKQGNLQAVGQCLGRPYSIYAPVIKGDNRGKTLGFPTANLSVEGLCLPPLGVYAIHLTHAGKIYPGIANLGIAPTVKITDTPILEVHLFDQDPNINLYGQFVEVSFQAYLRPEQRFASFDLLKAQIIYDIKSAKEKPMIAKFGLI